MKSTTIKIFLTGFFSLGLSSAVIANTEQTQANGIIAPYGDNPNIAHVLVYKAQEKLIDGAQKVGEVTSSGVAKVKPSIDQAWSNTKNLVSRGGEQAKVSSQQAAENVNEKLQETKQAVFPQQQNPSIQQQSLSDSSHDSPQNLSQSQAPIIATPNTAQTYAVTDL